MEIQLAVFTLTESYSVGNDIYEEEIPIHSAGSFESDSESDKGKSEDEIDLNVATETISYEHTSSTFFSSAKSLQKIFNFHFLGATIRHK